MNVTPATLQLLARQLDASPSIIARSGGPFGVVAAHYAGGKVEGIRRDPGGRWEIHVVMAADSTVALVETDVLAATTAVGIGDPVDIYIEDIAAGPPALPAAPVSHEVIRTTPDNDAAVTAVIPLP